MNKIFLIAQREYLTRVRKKSFIISTLLLPLLYLGLVFGSGYLAKSSMSNIKIAVQDTNNQFTADEFKKISGEKLSFELTTADSNTLKKEFKAKGYTAYCILPKLSLSEHNQLTVQSDESKSELISKAIGKKIDALWSAKKLSLLGIDVAKKESYEKSDIAVNIVNVNDEKANGKIAGNISQILGLLIYFVILIYGSQVMMSVMEEKTNRIAEVIVSSVKPFQLMFGKLLGVGLVALTQFLLWIGLILVIYNVMQSTGANTGVAGSVVEGFQNTFKGVQFGTIIVFFIIYFVGGFFFYASIYAALGSAVSEDIKDAQQLSFPITMLVIFSLLIAQMTANDPSSGLARWASLIPISSPFVMMSRIPFGVPSTVAWWEIALSLVLLYGSIILVAWGSAKIYRTGILMYGKKVTLKELLKWLRAK